MEVAVAIHCGRTEARKRAGLARLRILSIGNLGMYEVIVPRIYTPACSKLARGCHFGGDEAVAASCPR